MTDFSKIIDINTTEQGNKELILDFCPIIYPKDTKILLLKNFCN